MGGMVRGLERVLVIGVWVWRVGRFVCWGVGFGVGLRSSFYVKVKVPDENGNGMNGMNRVALLKTSRRRTVVNSLLLSHLGFREVG